MPATIAVLESGDDEFFIIGRSEKRKFERDSDESETASVVEIEDSYVESVASRPIIIPRGKARSGECTSQTHIRQIGVNEQNAIRITERNSFRLCYLGDALW
jgi:hypothetical protein